MSYGYSVVCPKHSAETLGRRAGIAVFRDWLLVEAERAALARLLDTANR
ncbi:MAG: hypothetical protein HOH66_12745 [Rhodospirillaceae bacterium]|nr:hypothetical protein [Rhodospirillaceae bacterium]MBT6118727.1 hypothetical protein [Rhodospirillaceae bacterium]